MALKNSTGEVMENLAGRFCSKYVDRKEFSKRFLENYPRSQLNNPREVENHAEI
jgi:hypothetical protein